MKDDNTDIASCHPPTPPVPTLKHLTSLPEIVCFIAAYLVVDWATYLHPLHGLNLTPWNPAPALGMVYLLRHRWHHTPVLLIAIGLAESFLRDGNRSLALVLGNTLLLTLGYTTISFLLAKRRPESGWFEQREHLLAWATVIVAGSLLNGAVLVGWLVESNQVPADDWIGALFRFWVGDSVGIGVAMPLAWWLSDPHSRSRLWQDVGNWETSAYTLLGVVTLGLSFGLGGQAAYKYCYFLFLPIVWAASRQGISGAIVSAALIQLGIIVAAQIMGFSAASLLEIQLLTLALALVGFFVGVVVDEQRRAAMDLRHSLRLAAAGEMAAALAHELNQPLTALSAYSNACQQLLAMKDHGPRLENTVQRMMLEATRAGDVVRRLRDFFRTGATRMENILLPELLSTSLDRFRPRAEAEGVNLRLGDCPELTLQADRLQLEVVLRNLISNSLDAVTPNQPGGLVTLGAAMESSRRVAITVEDNGPGFTGDAAALFEPFLTTKSHGMGLGLAISRAIAEAHGGQLKGIPGPRGFFILSLPLEDASLNGNN